MRLKEKVAIEKAIEHFESNRASGFLDGIAILYELIGNPNYRMALERERSCSTVTLTDLLTRRANGGTE